MLLQIGSQLYNQILPILNASFQRPGQEEIKSILTRCSTSTFHGFLSTKRRNPNIPL